MVHLHNALESKRDTGYFARHMARSRAPVEGPCYNGRLGAIRLAEMGRDAQDTKSNPSQGIDLEREEVSMSVIVSCTRMAATIPGTCSEGTDATDLEGPELLRQLHLHRDLIDKIR